MSKRSDTYSLAYECCNTVFLDEGRFPTIDAIRDRIHINSPAVIKRAMNDWTLHFVERHRQKLEHPAMPAVIVDASESLWKLALVEAQKTFAAREQELSTRELNWASQIQGLQQQLTNQLQQQEAEKRQWSQALTEQVTLAETLSAQLETTTQTLKATESALALHREQLSRAEGALAEGRSAHEAQAREWSEKLEQDHLWHLRRIEEEKEAARAQQAQRITQLNRSLEIATHDQASLQSRLTQIMNQVSDQLERQGLLENQIGRLREQFAAQEQALRLEKDKTTKLQALVKKQRGPAKKSS